MKRIYVAGPMRGIPQFNFPAFDAARDRLKEQGWDVISPADLDREAGFDPSTLPADYDWTDLAKIGFSLDDAITRDVEALKTVDAIYMLDGWERSKGANAEFAIANWRGIEILYDTPKIIGLCGYPGVGKDEVAKYLVEHHGYVRIAFADAMREDLLKLDPIVEYTFGMNSLPRRLSHLVLSNGWDVAKRRYPEVRRLLQVYGTEVGRDGFGSQVWVERTFRKLRNYLDQGNRKFVFTDVRFANEVDWLRSRRNIFPGFDVSIVHISREGYGPINSHASEGLDYPSVADLTIKNNGTLEQLHEAVKAIA